MEGSLCLLEEFARGTIEENFRDGHSEAPLETSLVWQGVRDGWVRN